MGDTTLELRDRTTIRPRTVLHLALPAAVAVHALGTLVSHLVISALMGSRSSSSLSTVLTVSNVVISLAVVSLCVAALTADRAATRSGRGRHRGWNLATRTLSAALLVPALHAVLWYTGRGLEQVPGLSMAVAWVCMLLAAVALVAGVIAATRDEARHGAAATATTAAAVASPAALLTPVIGVVGRSTGAYTVATYAGLALAVVGLVAAVVALRGDTAGALAGGATGSGAAGSGDAGAVRAGSRGHRVLRHLATPLALAALLLAAPSLTAGDDGALAVMLLVAAFVLAVAGTTGAVLEVRAGRRDGRVRIASGLAAFTLPLAVALVPAALALAALFGDEAGWAVLGALFISVPLAAVVALAGLIAAIVAASARQYPGRAAAVSVVCTALVPVALALFVPLQAAGLALVSAVLAGLLLLAALVSAVVAVVSDGAPRARTPGTAQNPYL